MATATTVAKWGLTRYQHIRIIILPPSLTSLGKMHARVHGLNNITTSMGIWLESANPILMWIGVSDGRATTTATNMYSDYIC